MSAKRKTKFPRPREANGVIVRTKSVIEVQAEKATSSLTATRGYGRVRL